VDTSAVTEQAVVIDPPDAASPCEFSVTEVGPVEATGGPGPLGSDALVVAGGLGQFVTSDGWVVSPGSADGDSHAFTVDTGAGFEPSATQLSSSNCDVNLQADGDDAWVVMCPWDVSTPSRLVRVSRSLEIEVDLTIGAGLCWPAGWEGEELWLGSTDNYGCRIPDVCMKAAHRVDASTGLVLGELPFHPHGVLSAGGRLWKLDVGDTGTILTAHRLDDGTEIGSYDVPVEGRLLRLLAVDDGLFHIQDETSLVEDGTSRLLTLELTDGQLNVLAERELGPAQHSVRLGAAGAVVQEQVECDREGSLIRLELLAPRDLSVLVHEDFVGAPDTSRGSCGPMLSIHVDADGFWYQWGNQWLRYRG
jgi:hypothetical protein